MEKFIGKFHPVTREDLYNISLASANAKSKELYVYEMGNLGDLIGQERAEIVRKEFLRNGIKVKELSNDNSMEPFSENDEFMEKVMDIRYISKDVFYIKYEIIIFDNTVAIYNTEKMLIVEDEIYASIYKQIFMSSWDKGETINLSL